MTKLSRSKLELLFECPRCFWFYAGRGVARPFVAPYTINNAVDFLLKREFDEHRRDGTAHYLIKRANIDAIPFLHDDIDKWRTRFTGVQYYHRQTDLLVFGAVDDIWVDSLGNLIAVDYKASGAKQGKLYDSYKRQLEVYQWLLRRNGFKVLDRGYFVYCRVNKDHGFRDGKLSFDIKVQSYDGNDEWVEGKIFEARRILDGPMPEPSINCLYCRYTNATMQPPIDQKTRSGLMVRLLQFFKFPTSAKSDTA